MTPIVLFAYRRKDHLERTVRSLLQNPESKNSELILYCDGAKNTGDEKMVQEVRDFAKSISGFSKTTIHAREKNLGLAQSIITGLNEVFQHHDRSIIIEDDLVVSPHFLRFMNGALTRYEDNERVASVCGYSYPVKKKLPGTFFLREADCWGWATWKHGWKLFNADGTALLSQIEQRGLQKDFDMRGSYPYTQMLRDQIAGKNNSWAIRWQASVFLAGKLTLYPGKSLVKNIGFDNSGEHCATTDDFDVEIAREPVDIRPIPIETNKRVEKILAAYFRSISQPARSFRNRVGQMFRSFMR